MTPDDVAALAAIMVKYRLSEIQLPGDITMKKTIHEIEQPQREPRARPDPRDPMEDDPIDDEVLFHSTQALHATVDHLIRTAEAAKEPDGAA